MKKLFLMLFLSLLIVSTSKAQIPIIPKAVGDTIVVLSPVFDGLSFADSIWNQKKLQMDSCAWSQGFYSNPVQIIPVLSDLISETDTVSLDFGNGLVDTVLVGIDAIFYSISRGGEIQDSINAWETRYNHDLLVILAQGRTITRRCCS